LRQGVYEKEMASTSSMDICIVWFLNLKTTIGRWDIVHLLLQNGADIHLPKHDRYRDAAEKAREHGHTIVAGLIEGWAKIKEGERQQQNLQIFIKEAKY
jgi:hypothetical protein